MKLFLARPGLDKSNRNGTVFTKENKREPRLKPRNVPKKKRKRGREQNKRHLNRHTPNVFAKKNRRAATDATHSSVYFAHTQIHTNKNASTHTRTFMLIDEEYDKETLTHTQASKQQAKEGDLKYTFILKNNKEKSKQTNEQCL